MNSPVPLRRAWLTLVTTLLIGSLLLPALPTAAVLAAPRQQDAPPTQPPTQPSAQPVTLPELGSPALPDPTLPETLVSAAPTVTETTVSPHRISTDALKPGESLDATITVMTDADPIEKGDVMFVFDLTGSMGAELAETKVSATAIMTSVSSVLAKTWFGVASFMDYNGYYAYPGYAQWYGWGTDYPWRLDRNPSADVPTVAAALKGLSLGNGEDGPEDYTRVLHELLGVTWRSGTKKIAVLFGDAPTHDLNFAGYNNGGDPGPDNKAQTADDLDFETTVGKLREAGITVVAVNSGSDGGSTGATFRAMSVGYGGVAGTNGQYFQLSQASDISKAVTTLILNEVTLIDKLELKVTDTYKDWVQLPAPITRVPANATRTLDLKITVPAGTQPGFYPFMLQTIGDGNILDVTYVDITVPGEAAATATGFDPKQDGFSFANDMSREATWAMFRQYFGQANVEYANGDHIGTADLFFNKSYKSAGMGGLCSGFSAQANGNRFGMQPLAGSFTMRSFARLADQPKSDELVTPIIYAQAIQMGLEVAGYRQYICENLGASPAAHYRYIRDSIARGVPVQLDFFWMVGGEMAGHTMVPFRYEQPSGDVAYLYVYDPNHPKDNGRKVIFDLKQDTWTYQLDEFLGVPIAQVSGDAKDCRLKAVPLELYRRPGVPFWGLAHYTGTVSTGEVSAGLEALPAQQVLMTSGPMQLLITDAEERRLGFDGGEFYDEIPGASFAPLIQQAGASSWAGSYYVPAGLALSLKAQMAAAGSPSLLAIRDGIAFAFDWHEVEAGGVLQASFPDATTVLLHAVAAQWPGSLTINRLFAGEDRQATVKNLFLEPGASARFSLADAATGQQVAFSTDASSAAQVQLALARAGGSGYQALGVASLALTPGDALSVPVADWNSLDGLTAGVDSDGNGAPDRRVPLVDEAQPARTFFEPTAPTVGMGVPVSLSLAVLDQFDGYVRNGVPVTFATDLGELSAAQPATSGGRATVQFRSASAGVAHVRAEAGGVATTLTLTVMPNAWLYLPTLRK